MVNFTCKKSQKKKTKDEPGPEQKIWDREPEPVTFTGLALFLGFNSLQEFVDYGNNGEFAPVLKRGYLRIEAAYEKKLHNQSSTGAIFALKSMGWNDKNDGKSHNAPIFLALKVEIIESGPKPAGSEKEVIL